MTPEERWRNRTDFAVVPEWVLFHPELSDRAVRVYGYLRRWSDRHQGQAVSRSALVDTLPVKISVPTLDRALAELRRAGAISIAQTTTLRGRGPSVYTVESDPPGREVAIKSDRNPVAIKSDGHPPGDSEEVPIKSDSGKGIDPLSSLNPRAATSSRAPEATASPSDPNPKPGNGERAALWDAVCDACGIDQTGFTPDARKQLGRTVVELLAAGATPDEVYARAGRWKSRYPNATLTHRALRGRWPELGNVAPMRRRDEQNDPEALRRAFEICEHGIERVVCEECEQNHVSGAGV